MIPYREYPPHLALAPYVACYWSITSPAPLINRILPDGCTDIVVSDTIEAVGTMSQAIVLPVLNQSLTVGIRFKPGAGAVFFRLPLHELTDATLDIHNLWGNNTHDLTEQLAEATTAHQKITLLEAFLL